MLENLILQAEVALLQKSKPSGKVLQDYKLPIKDEEKQLHVQGQYIAGKTRKPYNNIIIETLQKLTKKSTRVLDNHKPPPTRRASEQIKPTSVKMSRTLSRQSSPPVLVSSTTKRAPSPRQPKAKWQF